MKKLLSIIISAVLMLSAAAVYAEDNGITIYVNGTEVCSDVGAELEDGVLMLPFRTVFEALGYTVRYIPEDTACVFARRGLKSVSVSIGCNEIYTEGGVEKLPVSVRIENGRTLIPSEAFSDIWSEELNIDLTWDKDARKVYISEGAGIFDHSIRYEGAERTLKGKDGTDLIYISYSYPIISNEENNAVIDSINSECREDCESYFSVIEEEYLNEAQEWYNAMQEESSERNRTVLMSFGLSFDIVMDKNDLLSLTCYEYYDGGGAHPNSTMSSKVFDLNSGKELELEDILNGTEQETEEMIYNKFIENLSEDAFFEGALKAELKNVSFYLTNDSLVLYFVPYQVAPYAAGYPTAAIGYEGNESIFKEKRMFNGA